MMRENIIIPNTVVPWHVALPMGFLRFLFTKKPWQHRRLEEITQWYTNQHTDRMEQLPSPQLVDFWTINGTVWKIYPVTLHAAYRHGWFGILFSRRIWKSAKMEFKESWRGNQCYISSDLINWIQHITWTDVNGDLFGKQSKRFPSWIQNAPSKSIDFTLNKWLVKQSQTASHFPLTSTCPPPPPYVHFLSFLIWLVKQCQTSSHSPPTPKCLPPPP